MKLSTLPHAVSSFGHAVRERTSNLLPKPLRDAADSAGTRVERSVVDLTAKLPDRLQPESTRWTTRPLKQVVLTALSETDEGPLSPVAIQQLLADHGREESISVIESTLALLAAEKAVQKHGPALWQATGAGD